MQPAANKKPQQFKENQIFAGVCGYLGIIEQQENQLQAYRQAITTRHDFHPLSLFNYLSKGEDIVTRRHIALLLEENRVTYSQEEIKIMFGLYGYKQKMDFGGFLNYIYPSSIQPLKYISTVGLKRYSGIPIQDGVNQEIICLFMLLIQKEIKFLQELENAKQESFPRLSKNQVKKIIKMIKKKGESKGVYEVTSDHVITFNEMRGCLRKSKNLSESKINVICRRLSMGKDNFISLQQIEYWLKSWNRLKNEENNDKEENPKTLMDDFENSICSR